MEVRKRRYGWTPAERAELWSRWRKGESFAEIASALDRVPLTIWLRVREAGGVPERPRQRATRALSASEREAISRGLTGGLSLRAIGRQLGRPASTISREVERNGGAAAYRSVAADKAAWQRAERPKRCKLSQNRWLRGQVARKLQHHWSPEQIAGWLSRTSSSACWRKR